MVHFKGLVPQPEDLFREVSSLMDFLLYAENVNQRKVDGLWMLLINDIRSWKPDVAEEDKMLMAGTVFTMARSILCHHTESRFRDKIHDMIENTLEKKLKIIDEQEQQEFLDNLSECAVKLDEWINHEDESNEWLSDEIDNVLNPEANAKPDEGTQNEPPTICLETVEKLLKPQFTINGSVFNSRGQLQKAVEEVDLEKNAQIGVLLAVCKEMGIVKPNTGNTDFVRILIGLGFIEYVNDEQIKRIAHGFSQKIKKLPPRHTQWSGDDKTLGDKLFGTLKQG